MEGEKRLHLESVYIWQFFELEFIVPFGQLRHNSRPPLASVRVRGRGYRMNLAQKNHDEVEAGLAIDGIIDF